MNALAIVSLIILVAAFAVGYFSNVNTGIICVAFAMILGHFVGMSDAKIIAGFGTKLFVELLGVMFLFEIANQNKALELIAKYAVCAAGSHTNLIPIIALVLSVFLSAIGCGCVPVMSLMAVFCAALAVEMDCNPVLMIPMALLGAQGGGTSPLATTGILGATIAADSGITENIARGLMFNQMLVSVSYALILYFVLGGHKIKCKNPIKRNEIPKFSKDQILSVSAIALVAICVLALRLDVGLCAFVAGAILLVLKCADQKKVFLGIPWSTLILITGVGILMNVVTTAGGIDLLASGLASIMTERTAVPLICLTAGIMSWFSSTSGVVMPTLIPTVGPLLQALTPTKITATAMISGLTATSHTAGNSPISTGGAIGLAAYCGLTGCGPEEERKLFNKLFLVSITGVLYSVFLGFLGVFSLIS